MGGPDGCVRCDPQAEVSAPSSAAAARSAAVVFRAAWISNWSQTVFSDGAPLMLNRSQEQSPSQEVRPFTYLTVKVCDLLALVMVVVAMMSSWVARVVRPSMRREVGRW